MLPRVSSDELGEVFCTCQLNAGEGQKIGSDRRV